jgi:hypothetical protein
MSAGSREGPGAILRAFKQLLIDNLQDELDAIALARGTPALTAPHAETGYALDRVIGQDYSPSIRIFTDKSDPIEEVHLLGAPRRWIQMIRIVVRYGNALDLALQTDAVGQYAQAIKTTIFRFWRVYNVAPLWGDVCLQDVRPASDERASSLRERYSNEGFTTMGGRGPTSDEEADVGVLCIQSVTSPISFPP